MLIITRQKHKENQTGTSNSAEETWIHVIRIGCLQS